jgi:hypothetical protein
MDTTIAPLTSIGIDIGKEVVHVGFGTDGKIAFVAAGDLDRLRVHRSAHHSRNSPAHASRRRTRHRERGEWTSFGLTYPEYGDAERNAVVHEHPREDHFKEGIIHSSYAGIRHKPETTFGKVKADVLADKDPGFKRGNFCSVIRGSAWPA